MAFVGVLEMVVEDRRRCVAPSFTMGERIAVLLSRLPDFKGSDVASP